MRPVIDPRMIGDALTGLPEAFYPSLASITSPTDTRGQTGQDVRAWTTIVTGLGAIPARVSSVSETRLIDTVTRRAGDTITVFTHIVSLRGYFPQIQTNWHITVDSLEYDIMAVDWDGNNQAMRLRVELVLE